MLMGALEMAGLSGGWGDQGAGRCVGVLFFKHYQCQCNYWLDDDVASSPSTRFVFPLDFCLSFIVLFLVCLFFFNVCVGGRGGEVVVTPYRLTASGT